ncbi:mucin-binding protein [Ligilactobacillus salivarius]|uniref:mucin-binding protein n=1 Tax=Ligilactobacillus salivarius TaxID=1624 RepID=UPI000B966BF0|nr:YSIRK-type signal peptide-containing protein [Ligilactobacillus salivarius]OYP91483.1 mucus-binding protein [Ligilactobacillus salivarius]
MLSKKNRILATNYKQRWAIRKLTVGVVSVLLGGTMLFISGTTVSADNLIPKNESALKVEEKVPNNNITEEKSINTSSEVITKETDTTIDKTTLNVSEIDQQNNVVSSETVPEKVQEITTMSDASVELDNNTPTSEVEKVQSQPTVFSYQPKESDSRKAEDGDNAVIYCAIVREVTIVKPNGDEEILPYESMDTYYGIESENDDLLLINFKAIDVPTIPGAKSPVIPGISQTVNSFMEDEIEEILDTSYVNPPVQRISGIVIPLPEEEKYDELYYLYESKYEEHEKEFAKEDIKLTGPDVLLIKEKYQYILDDDPKPIEEKEEKTITRTINVHLPNGEVQTTRQPVTLERKYTSVAGSDEKKYGPWTVGRWESFTAPEQEGYTAIPGTVDEVKVTSESLDAVVDIYYRADESAIVEGKEEKTITRTINVHLPNGEVQTTKQPVTLERKYTSVAGSDEKKYGPWTVGRWESFTAPEQEGYTAIPGAVDEVEVTSESLDAVVDIYYRADEPAIVEESEEVTDDPTPETSTTSPTPKNITNAKGKTATPELKNMDTKSKVFQNKLPQTGNKAGTIYSIIGLLLTSILGVWEIIRKR